MLDNGAHVLDISFGHERLRLEAWGADSIRVRAGQGPIDDGVPGALIAPPPPAPHSRRQPATAPCSSTASCGPRSLRTDWSAFGARTVTASSSLNRRLISGGPGHGCSWLTVMGTIGLSSDFRAYEDEKLFGLGQHLHGRFDQKGLVIDLVQRNAEVSVPFMVSSRGYGFLWNSPAVGRVELAANGTRWVADSARQIDYWVTTGDTPVDLLSHYADVTGHAPDLPSWASGFWQSKFATGPRTSSSSWPASTTGGVCLCPLS